MDLVDALVSRVRECEIFEDPFTHFVIEDFLPLDLYRELSNGFIMSREFYHAHLLLRDNPEGSAWYSYISALNSFEFQRAVAERLGADVKMIPEDLGLRKRDTQTPYVSESYIVLRRPSEDWVLHPHVDSEYAITSLVHYFPEPDDNAEGGDLVLMRKVLDGDPLNVDSIINYYDPGLFEIVKVIRYSANTLVGMRCSDRSWHGITPKTTGIRRSVNISLERQNSGRRKKRE